MYDTLQTIHVIAAIAWVGGSLFHLFAATQVTASPSPLVPLWAGLGDTAGRLYYGPAAAITLLAGAGAVAVGEPDWSDPFIGIGFAGVAVSLVIGFGLIRPTGRRLQAAIQATPPDPEELAALGGRVRNFSILNSVVLLVVVWAMVVKPG